MSRLPTRLLCWENLKSNQAFAAGLERCIVVLNQERIPFSEGHSNTVRFWGWVRPQVLSLSTSTTSWNWSSIPPILVTKGVTAPYSDNDPRVLPSDFALLSTSQVVSNEAEIEPLPTEALDLVMLGLATLNAGLYGEARFSTPRSKIKLDTGFRYYQYWIP